MSSLILQLYEQSSWDAECVWVVSCFIKCWSGLSTFLSARVANSVMTLVTGKVSTEHAILSKRPQRCQSDRSATDTRHDHTYFVVEREGEGGGITRLEREGDN